MAVRKKRTISVTDESIFDNQDDHKRSSAPVIEVVEINEEVPASQEKVEVNRELEEHGIQKESEYEMEEVAEPDILALDTEGETKEHETTSEEHKKEIDNTHKPDAVNTSVVPREEPIAQETDWKRKNDVVEEIYSKSKEVLENDEEIKSKPKIVLWSIMVIVAAITVGLGLIILTNNPQTTKLDVAVTTPTPTVQMQSPTPTAVKTIAKDEIEIEVLNGGGVVGAAGKMKLLLEEKGYNVSNVANADSYDYETTEIHVNSGRDDLLKLIEEDLMSDYEIGSTSSDLDSSIYDAQIIVGKE